MAIKKKYKLKLNSVEKIEELLQELYDESDRNIVEIQTEINKLTCSVKLVEESIDGKARYAKAVNDFIVNKDKAISRKLEIAKLMSEIMKFNGNVKQAVTEGEIPDWDAITDALGEEVKDDGPTVIKYKLK